MGRRYYRLRTGVAIDVESLLVVAVATEACRIPPVPVEAHHIIAGLIVALLVEAGAVEAERIESEGIETVHVVTGGIVAVVVETGAVETEKVVAVDVETGRVVDILRCRRLARLVDVGKSVALVAPPGLQRTIGDAVE